MKFCQKDIRLSSVETIEKLLSKISEGEVVGFFERKFTTPDQEMRVFIPVYRKSTKPGSLVN